MFEAASIPRSPTLAGASRELAAKIAKRYGANPAVVADLTFGALATAQVGSSRNGITLYAHPASGVRDIKDVLVAYYDASPRPVTEGE